jgi:hypothetical protein
MGTGKLSETTLWNFLWSHAKLFSVKKKSKANKKHKPAPKSPKPDANQIAFRVLQEAIRKK